MATWKKSQINRRLDLGRPCFSITHKLVLQPKEHREVSSGSNTMILFCAGGLSASGRSTHLVTEPVHAEGEVAAGVLEQHRRLGPARSRLRLRVAQLHVHEPAKRGVLWVSYSAITKPAVCLHRGRNGFSPERVPVKSHNSFLDQRSRKV